MTPTDGRPLSIAVISDIHLGHSRVPTQHIIKNLYAAFPNDEATASLDLLIIAGDLFDQLLTVPEDQVQEIKLWICHILRLAKRHDFLVRILKGTPSHDRDQSRLFPELNDMTGIDADCKYISILDIEYIERHQIHVLYVPDEWRHDPEDTWYDVQNALAQHQITHVDYAVMHGLFEYQLPNHVNLPCHRTERYLGITRRYIFIGHHHTYSHYDRIFSQGSFDRLAHGEGHEKGHIRLVDYGLPDFSNNSIRFIPNKNAMVFKTISVVGLTEDEVHMALREAIERHPPPAFFRVQIEPQSPWMGIVKGYMKVNPYQWSIKTISPDGSATKALEFRNHHTTVHLSPTNIMTWLRDRLVGKSYDSDTIEQITQLAKRWV